MYQRGLKSRHRIAACCDALFAPRQLFSPTGVRGLVFLIVLQLVAIVEVCVATSDESWTPLSTGMNNQITALEVFDDGSGPALYAGGSFSTAGGVQASRIAKWDGRSWSPLGSGIFHLVNAIRVFDDGSGPALYVGGAFSTAGGQPANNIAKWDGTSWSTLGTGVISGSVRALAVFDEGNGPALYAGGSFLAAGGDNAFNVAKWDGQTWSPVSPFSLFPFVNALAVFDDGTGPALYAGGSFGDSGGQLVNNVAKLVGTTWVPLGSGTNAVVNNLTVFDDGSGPALYAGGAFSVAGGVEANRIAKWNGTLWAPLGTGVQNSVLNGSVWGFAVFDDGEGPSLYVSGAFDAAGGQSAGNIAKWDGTAWTTLLEVGTPGVNTVWTLNLYDDGKGLALYAAGTFTSAGGIPANRIARFSSCTSVCCVGDLNGDNQVTLLDVQLFINALSSKRFVCEADANRDGVVNLQDVAFFVDLLGTSCSD